MRDSGEGKSGVAGGKSLKPASLTGKPVIIHPDTAGSLLAESLTGSSSQPSLSAPGSHLRSAGTEDRPPVSDDEI